MKASGKTRFAIAGKLISLAIIVLAAALGLYTLR